MSAAVGVIKIIKTTGILSVPHGNLNGVWLTEQSWQTHQPSLYFPKNVSKSGLTEDKWILLECSTNPAFVHNKRYLNICGWIY